MLLITSFPDSTRTPFLPEITAVFSLEISTSTLLTLALLPA
ncbi:hypothetical protein COI_0210 [Mannheimia haemolytica serotype A2 str. OVINE]|nr:hypothetical protein COI_0210 [Mannheimia haemolytica serotype A2 str. OVINE]